MSGARLVLASFLMLFVELALIRWAGSNIVYLSYFSNFVLLGSFLGIGLGFLRAGAKRDVSRWAPVALAALVAFVLVFPVHVDKTGSELIYFGKRPKTSGLPIWVTLPVIFALLGGESFLSDATSWSPYYKVRTSHEVHGLRVYVNGISHQELQRVKY